MQGRQLMVYGGEATMPRAGDEPSAQATRKGESCDDDGGDDDPEPLSDVCYLDRQDDHEHFWVPVHLHGALLAHPLLDVLSHFLQHVIHAALIFIFVTPLLSCRMMKSFMHVLGHHLMPVMQRGSSKRSRVVVNVLPLQTVCVAKHVHGRPRCVLSDILMQPAAGEDKSKEMPTRAGASMTALPDGRGFVFGEASSIMLMSGMRMDRGTQSTQIHNMQLFRLGAPYD
jgi:hypothetical protein